jgi:hypothetical protein
MKILERISSRPLSAIGIIILVLAFSFLLLTAPPEISSSVLAASTALLVATSQITASREREQERQIEEHKREIEREHRERKREIFQDFIDYWLDAMNRDPTPTTNKKKSKLDQAQRLKFVKKLASWGSPEFIKEYGDWLDLDNPQYEADIFSFERLIFFLRKEFGYDDTTLEEGDILRTWLEGVEEHRKRKSRSEQAKPHGTEPASR